MEAMASGRYCLAHCWEGADELLPAESLNVTNAELVEAILAFSDLDAADRRERIARQTALVHERFDIERIKVQVREVVEAVGAEWAPGRRT
jgi:hypothetical protein